MTLGKILPLSRTLKIRIAKTLKSIARIRGNIHSKKTKEFVRGMDPLC